MRFGSQDRASVQIIINVIGIQEVGNGRILNLRPTTETQRRPSMMTGFYGTVGSAAVCLCDLYLEHLLFLGDFVLNLPPDGAGDAPPRHLLKRLENSSARTRRNTHLMKI